MSIDGHCERSLTTEHIARHNIGDESTEGHRRRDGTFLAQHPAPSC
jgi:hypothetical protein